MTFRNKTIETIASAYEEGLEIKWTYPTTNRKASRTYKLTEGELQISGFTCYKVEKVFTVDNYNSLRIYTDGPTFEFLIEVKQ